MEAGFIVHYFYLHRQGYFLVLSLHAVSLWLPGFNFPYANHCFKQRGTWGFCWAGDFFFFFKKKKLKATHPDLVQLVSPEQTYTSMGVAFDAKERYNYPVRILSLSLMFSGSICAGLKQS